MKMPDYAGGDSAIPEVFFDNLESVFKVKECCDDSKPLQPSTNAQLSQVEESDIRLAKDIMFHLGLSDDKTFDALSTDDQAWLPDGYSRIFRIVCVWPFGLLDYGSATLRCKI